MLWFRKTTSIFLRSIFSATMSPRLPALWIIRSGAKFPSKNLGSNVFLYIYIYIYILHFWLSMQREVVHKSSGSRFFVRPISRPATAESIHYWMLLRHNHHHHHHHRLTYNCAHLRSTKKKKEENIWRKKMFFTEGTINGEGKGG